jgi:hypothetical protein
MPLIGKKGSEEHATRTNMAAGHRGPVVVRQKEDPLAIRLAIIPLITAALMFGASLWPEPKNPDLADHGRCLDNLRHLTELKKGIAIERKWSGGTRLTKDVLEFFETSKLLTCPAGGTIKPGNIGAVPECTLHGTAMEWERSLSR